MRKRRACVTDWGAGDAGTLLTGTLGVFRGFSQICTPEGQENFGFPALFPVPVISVFGHGTVSGGIAEMPEGEYPSSADQQKQQDNEQRQQETAALFRRLGCAIGGVILVVSSGISAWSRGMPLSIPRRLHPERCTASCTEFCTVRKIFSAFTTFHDRSENLL